MMMGPEPMMRILRRSVRLGMKRVESQKLRVKSSMNKAGSPWSNSKQVQLEPGQFLDHNRLAFLERTRAVHRANDVHLTLLGIDPELNHSVRLIAAALFLNIEPPITRRNHFKGNIGREGNRPL